MASGVQYLSPLHCVAAQDDAGGWGDDDDAGFGDDAGGGGAVGGMCVAVLGLAARCSAQRPGWGDDAAGAQVAHNDDDTR